MDTQKTLAARLGELATRAARSGRPAYTRFLDPSEVRLAASAAGQSGASVKLWGGYEDAERVVCCFYTDEEPAWEWPFCCLYAKWDQRYARLTHRDLLGSLMALGIIRETIGDIVVRDGQIFLFALDEMADYIAQSLVKAGKASLQLGRLSEIPQMPPPAGSLIRDTVASLRLDAVLAAGYRLSRGDASQAIREGRVRVNYMEETRPDALIGAGALLSVRGMGRVRVEQIDGPTRKGRIAIVLFRYE